MNKTRKRVAFVLAAATLFACTSAFVACKPSTPTDQTPPEQQASDYELKVNTDSLVIFTVNSVDGEVRSVHDALTAFQSAGELTFDGYNGDYGFMLTTVNGKKQPDDWSSYWSLYTTLGEKDGVVYGVGKQNNWQTGEEEDVSYTYDGVRYLYGMYGVDGMLLVEGESYVLRYIEG